MRLRRRRKLTSPGQVEVHSEVDLAKMLWTKYLRPVDLPTHEGFDATAAIAGDTGMGKSELAVSIQLALSKFTGQPFSVKKNIVYTREQLDDAIRTLPRYSGIIVDEAVNVLFSRDDQKNSKIIKVLEACRSRNLAIFFCMPDFSAMDSKARNSRIRFWIDIRKVGEGLEFIRMRRTAANPHLTDPWNNWAFKEIGSNYAAHPNFIGLIRWTRIPDSMREEYVEWKHSSELLSDQSVEQKDVSIESFIAWLKDEGYYQDMSGLQSRAAEFLDRDRSTIAIKINKRRQKQ